MSRNLSCWRRASSWISPAISGSSASSCGMGGWCMGKDLLVVGKAINRRRREAGSGGGGTRDRSIPSVLFPQAATDRTTAMSTTIILDCDPGIDDALAIAFAAGSPEIELAGLTTVAGNVELAKTTANALAVASFVGLGSVPVTAGCGAPLLRPALHAGHVHGESGLGGAVLPTPARTAEAGHAIDFIISSAAAAPGEITLVATGPRTTIGLARRREPRLASWVRDFVIMGGSASRGNVTPAAEFNIWADPEAAAIVFGAQWPNGVRMIGLDVTLLARATGAVQDRMRALGELGSRLLLPALAQYRDSSDTAGAAPGDDGGGSGS